MSGHVSLRQSYMPYSPTRSQRLLHCESTASPAAFAVSHIGAVSPQAMVCVQQCSGGATPSAPLTFDLLLSQFVTCNSSESFGGLIFLMRRFCFGFYQRIFRNCRFPLFRMVFSMGG